MSLSSEANCSSRAVILTSAVDRAWERLRERERERERERLLSFYTLTKLETYYCETFERGFVKN